jgi:hypothetical protein
MWMNKIPQLCRNRELVRWAPEGQGQAVAPHALKSPPAADGQQAQAVVAADLNEKHRKLRNRYNSIRPKGQFLIKSLRFLKKKLSILSSRLQNFSSSQKQCQNFKIVNCFVEWEKKSAIITTFLFISTLVFLFKALEVLIKLGIKKAIKLVENYNFLSPPTIHTLIRIFGVLQ